MWSRNEWEIEGSITSVREHRKGAVITVKGDVYRTDICNFRLYVDCVFHKDLYEMAKLSKIRPGKQIKLSGHLRFGKNTYFVAESFKMA